MMAEWVELQRKPARLNRETALRYRVRCGPMLLRYPLQIILLNETSHRNLDPIKFVSSFLVLVRRSELLCDSLGLVVRISDGDKVEILVSKLFRPSDFHTPRRIPENTWQSAKSAGQRRFVFEKGSKLTSADAP